LTVHEVNDVRQTEMHTTEPLVSGLSAFEIELAIEKLKSYKTPGVDQIPAELIKAGVEKFAMRSINLLCVFGIRRNCLQSRRRQRLYLCVSRAIKQIVVIIEAYLLCKLHTNFHPTSCSQG
jgi:hypothetical protein